MRLQRPVRIAALAALLAGCATLEAPPPGSAPPPAPDRGPLGSPFAGRDPAAGFPLVLDRGDLALGTTVQFARMPTLAEVTDLAMVTGLRRVVIALPAWPAGFAALEVLESLPVESEALVVLRGYPPTRAAAEAWNMVDARLRMVVVVGEPPPASGVIADLNTLRALERVIVESDAPARTGFERLQRPLSFRVLRE